METKKLNWKRIGIIASIVVGTLLLIYLVFAIYFMNHFQFHTTLNGLDVSGNSIKVVRTKMEKGLEDYVLSLEERDGKTETLSGKDFSLKLEWDESAVRSKMKQKNGFAWIGSVFKKTNLETETLVSYDEAKLEECMSKLECFDKDHQLPSADAYIAAYDEKEGYKLVEEVYGTQIDEPLLLKKIDEAVNALETKLVLEDTGVYHDPTVTSKSDKLVQAYDTLCTYEKASITYTVGSSTTVLDASTFGNWFTVDENQDIITDESALSEYVHQLGLKYDTYYTPKIFVTSYNNRVVTFSGDKLYYGWLIDSAAEKTQILQDIQSGKAVKRDLNYKYTANSHEGADYGNSYLEINLTAQHLFLYKNGSLVLDTDFVSGNLLTHCDTPTGIYFIGCMGEQIDLVGEDYVTRVNYWMQFHEGYGLHDATWRSVFGAAYYQRSGSHGCVNLPLDKAGQIYNNISEGYPVIVYYLDGTESEEGKAQMEAYKVMDAIKAIKKADLTTEPEVVKAREQYDALSEKAKPYVENYNDLVKMEEAIEKLKPEETKDEDKTDKPAETKPAN